MYNKVEDTFRYRAEDPFLTNLETSYMEQDYTSEKIIQYIYGECDLFERLEIENALLHDLGLRGEYQELRDAYRALPKVTFSPATETVNSILAFANNQLSATA